MNAYERLEEEARENNIDIIDYPFNNNIKGIYYDGSIGLSDKIKSCTEKTCILAEELGHHYTTVGNILDQKDPASRKQEMRARVWAYDRLIGLQGIINAYEAGCRNCYEMADHLGVTEEALSECLDAYREKYGTGVRQGKYYIIFDPILAVGKTV